MFKYIFVALTLILLYEISQAKCQSPQLMKEVDDILSIKINFNNIEKKVLPTLLKDLSFAMDIANYLCKK